MSEFKVGFQSVHTNRTKWFTNTSGEVVAFDESSAKKEFELQERKLAETLSKRRYYDPNAQLNTRVVMEPLH